jgi:hypothetical protein
MSPRKESDNTRFDALFKAAKPENLEQPSIRPKEEKVSKSANPDYFRTTVYLPKSLHKRLKAAAAEDEREISQIIEQLVEGWLDTRSDV